MTSPEVQLATHAGDPLALPMASARAEQRALNAFWAAARTERRLELLMEYTFITIRRQDGWDAKALRAEHTATNHGGTVSLDRKQCFACQAVGQLYRHHVIELQHGGSNSIRNQVPLCFECHKFLHPWLTDADRAPSDAVSGFESVGQMISRGGAQI